MFHFNEITVTMMAVITLNIIAIIAILFADSEVRKALRELDKLSASLASERAKADSSSVALTEASKASIEIGDLLYGSKRK